MTHLRQLAALAVAPLVLLAACTPDYDFSDTPPTETTKTTTDPQPYIDATVSSLTAEEDLGFDEENATCIATALVDVIGADALARAKVTPAEFAAADTFDVLAVDVPADATEQLRKGLDACDAAGAFSSAFVAALGVDVAPEDTACLTDGLDQGALNDALAEGFLNSTAESGQRLEDTIEEALLDAVLGCPGVVTAAFLAQAPGTVTPETEACVSQVIEANTERVRAAFGGDSAAADALGAEIGTSCAATLGG